MAKLLTLILLGLSVGLGNFAAAIAIGLDGIDHHLRLKIAVVFGLFETFMPVLGLLLGSDIADKLGSNASIIGGSLLILTGLYILSTKFKNGYAARAKPKISQSFSRLLIAGLALSLDNLIIGFSLGTRKEPIVISIIVMGVVSISLSLLGLELGKRLSTQYERYSGQLSGAILILVGLLLAVKLL